MKNRSIDKRLMLILIASTLVLTLLVGLTTVIMLNHKEQKWAYDRSERLAHMISSLVSNRFATIRVFAQDSASNSNTSMFIDDANLDYVINTRYRKGLIGGAIDGLLLQGPDGEYLFGTTQLSTEISDKLWSELLAPQPEAQFKQAESGLVFIGRRVFLYAAEPVTNPVSGNASMNGRLTVIREQTQARLESISAELGESVIFRITQSPEVVSRWSFVPPPTIQLHKLEALASFMDLELTLKTEDGQMLPIVLNVRFARMQELFVWLVPQLVVILAIFTLILWLLRRQITGPIAEIAAHLEQSVADFDGGIAPLPQKDGRELRSLVDNINCIFARFEQQNKFREMLLNSIGEVILVVDRDGHICFANPAASHWLRLDEQRLAACPLDYLLTNMTTDSPAVGLWLPLLQKGDKSLHYRCLLRRAADFSQPVAADVYLHPVQDEQSRSAATLIIRPLPTSGDEDRGTSAPADPSAASPLPAVAEISRHD